MAANDIWRLAWQGVCPTNQEYVNVWHIKFKSGAATVAGAVSYINTNFYDLVKANQTPAFLLSSVHGRQLAVPAPVDDVAISVQGTDSGPEGLPPQSAMVISLRTGIAGRSYRGRLYLGGFGEDKQANGGWIAGLLSGMQTYVDDLVAALGSGGSNSDYEWGVWSRVLGGDDPGPYNLSAGWHAITSGIVRPTVYTQRRRTLGVGA